MLVRSMVQGRQFSDRKFVNVTLLTDVELSVSRMCEMFQKFHFFFRIALFVKMFKNIYLVCYLSVHLHCVGVVRRGRLLVLKLC